ncbi:MAG: hypothetical protein M3O86_00620, partial [Actinomycetota bacterium]|nr:hypothetical protein [Actinomycetota bacterium]
MGNGATLRTVAAGAVAGAAGVWAMDKVGWALYGRESPRALDRERAARVDGQDTAHAAVRTV